MNLRLITAELLKLRKRRGLFWWSLALSVGVVTAVFAVLEVLHLTDPSHHVPPGGLGGYQGALIGLSLAGSVAAILVGSAAGTADVSTGVFRDLVATGRSRWTLFAARVPGALAFFVPMITLGYIVIAVSSLGLAGHYATPSWELLARGYGWILLATSFDLMLALGLSSLIGSRGTTIGVLIGWQFLAAPLLANATLFGAARQALFPGALNRLAPIGVADQGAPILVHSVVAAVVVLVGWTAIALGVGAWRTATRPA
jgi:hypothetical protein